MPTDPKPAPRVRRARRGLRSRSPIRESRIPERHAALEIVFARDGQTCQFWKYFDRWLMTQPNAKQPRNVAIPDCHGRLTGHELRKTSHYPEDYYDPQRIVSLCVGHNEWVDDFNDFAVAIGLRIPTTQEE